MRQLPYQYGEFSSTTVESFGRIARQRAVPASFAAVDAELLARSASRPDATELTASARAARAVFIGALFASALNQIARLVRGMRDAARERSEMRATIHALRQLDSRTLRDLGFHRSEIASVERGFERGTDHASLRSAHANHALRLF